MADDPEREALDADPLDALAARIRDAKAATETPQKAEAPAEDADLSASRIGAEFAAAILVGAGLGWLADRFFGTSPWGILLLLLLGFAAGLMNVWRGLNGYGQAVGFRQRHKEE